MRPHVELIHEDDYIWHAAEFHKAEGSARQRNLSVDEEDGSASTSVVFDSSFDRPAGYHVADTEWYVLEGEIDSDLVTAHRIDPLGGCIGIGETAPVPGVAVVVEDHLSIELLERHQPTPKSSPARRRPDTRASTSASSL